MTVLILVAAACSRPQSHSPLLATVNGDPITLADYRKTLDNRLWNFGDEVSLSKEQRERLRSEVLESLFRRRILLQEAARLGISVSEEALKKTLADFQDRYSDQEEFEQFLQSRGQTFSGFKRQRAEDLKIKELFRRVVDDSVSITERDLKDYYRDHQQEFFYPREVRVRQIVTDSLEKGKALRELIVGKESPFAEVAEKYSLTPDRSAGGDLGWFGRGVMPQEFDKICFHLPVGVLSPVVKTRYGYHIFEVMGTRGPGKFSFAVASPTIRRRLMEEQGQEIFSSWYETLRKSADLQVHLELLSAER